MPNFSQFSSLLREWHSLNANLITNESLSQEDRAQLLEERKIYSELFATMEGHLDEHHK